MNAQGNSNDDFIKLSTMPRLLPVFCKYSASIMFFSRFVVILSTSKYFEAFIFMTLKEKLPILLNYFNWVSKILYYHNDNGIPITSFGWEL